MKILPRGWGDGVGFEDGNSREHWKGYGDGYGYSYREGYGYGWAHGRGDGWPHGRGNGWDMYPYSLMVKVD